MSGLPRSSSIDREIWALLWPVMLLTLAQKFGSAFEGILVSVNNPVELTVTGICGPYITLITTVSYGLGIAINAMTGRAVGEGLFAASSRRYARAMVLPAIICGAILASITALLMAPAFSAVPEMRAMGYRYMLPYLFGSPVLLLFSVLIAAMRGLGDTKAGMWMTFISVPIQLAISWAFYKAWGLAALGYGTLLSRTAACIWGMVRYRKHLPVKGESGNAPLPGGFMRGFLSLAAPVSLSKAIAPAGNAILNGLLISLSSTLVSVQGLGGRLEAFFYLPAMAMGSVAVTLAAQRAGQENSRALYRRLCLWSVLPTLVLIAGAQIFAPFIWRLLTPDAALADVGASFWRICLWAYPMIALEMALTSILQAHGYGMPALAATGIRIWCVQIPLTYLSIYLGWGAAGAWGAYLVSNAVSLAICALWAFAKLNKKAARSKEESL